MKKIIFIISLLLAVTFPATAQIQTPQPKKIAGLKEFKKMMILDAGRIKPVDTFARNFLLRLSGRKTVEKESASDWFARFIFAPESTVKDKVFLINHPSIATALGIEADHKRRYSFADLEASFPELQKLAQSANEIDSKKRDIIENEILRLYENVTLYSKLSLSLSFGFPHNDFAILDPDLKDALGLARPIQKFSFLDIAKAANELQMLMLPLEKKPQAEWTSAEREIVNLVNTLVGWSAAYQQLPFHIIPAPEKDDESFFSPWDMLSGGLSNPSIRKEILALSEAMMAYWNGEQVAFDLALKAFNQSVNNRLEAKNISLSGRIQLEIIFNQLNLFTYAKLFYLITFFIFLLGLIRPHAVLYRTGVILTLAAFSLHLFALILRMMILHRPPVSNLYETFIFVGFVSALSGLLIEWRSRRWLGLVISSVSGFIFLTIAGKFSVEGDTLQVLIAVLNSNFWLGTHVLSITIGYAGACVAGLIGHIYILQTIFKPKDKELLNSTYKTLLGALGFALTMTFLGTNLGGIWADQSWGRFWGWDPKENGALLIIIWTAILFHAKVGNFIGPLGLAAGAALGIIVVMWAWFGVNLLSIGLHSYGFTSGLATNLAIYFVLQLLFIIIAVPMAKRKSYR